MGQAPLISSDAEDWIQKFIYDLKSNEDLSSKTLKQYSGDLRHLANWTETTWNRHQDKDISFCPTQMTTPTIGRYREFMQTVQSLRPATINRRLNTVKRFVEWAFEKKIIAMNVAKPIKLVPEEKTSPRQMTDKEEHILITTVQNRSLRDYTLILLMLHTGLRSMELCLLQRRDIIIGKRSGRLMVRSGKRNKQREVPLNATIRHGLNHFFSENDFSQKDYLFCSKKTGNHLGERALRHIIQKYMRLAGLEGLSAHDLRHRFGYVMAERTPLHRLAQIMGHDSLDTTMTYIRATREDLQKEVEKIAWQ
ncbi:tyrosine-type recombinase/integrase [Salibacterium halotolerans]|uniref:Integrase/recombinase XerC n=1 Tax=Salibacterium halotolerans TaxID=1884432 RepID=A0A1I5YDT2_9BACI|nr:tyrosine-type recombinase/integrase [Salibacterium halotolerans]SFQ42369.1 integrase/recombinase XerC [Salibacterium halotolerans]